MKFPQLDQLRGQLASNGYSPAYVTRLCGELEDHYRSVIEEQAGDFRSNSTEETNEMAARRVGTVDNLHLAVVKTRELTPLAQRNPLLVFVCLPGLLLCLLTWCLINVAYQIGLTKTDFYGREWLLNQFDVVSAMMAAMIAAGFVLAAVRFKSHWIFPFVTTTIISLYGFYQIDLAGCAASGGNFFASDWGFSAWNFAAPWIGFVSLFALFVLTGNRSRLASQVTGAKSHLPSAIWAGSSLPRPFPFSICILAVAVTFVCIIEKTRVLTSIHPADNIVQSYNETGTLRALMIGLIEKPTVKNELLLSPSHSNVINQLVKNYHHEANAIAEEWRAEHPQARWRVIGTSEFIGPLQKATTQINEHLTERQYDRLKQLAYANLGWNAVFRKEIKKRLAISERQIEPFKDALVEEIRATSRIQRLWSRSPNANRQQLAIELRAVKAKFESKIKEGLSKTQRVRIAELWGSNPTKDTLVVGR